MAAEPLPLVSVIICFLNVEAFLQEAVDSVLEQDYTHWEMILVDDGSTDASTNLAREYVRKYPHKIQYIEHIGHINKGLSASRNVGIRKACGELLAFLDADDVWFPNKLTRQVAIMKQQSEAGALFEATEYWYNWADPNRQNRIKFVGVPPNLLYRPPQLNLKLYPLGTGEAPSMSALMVRKAIFQTIGFEESFRGMYEDQAFLTKLYLQTNVFVTDMHTHRYRQRVGSLTHESYKRNEYNHIRSVYLNWLEIYLREQHVTDKRLHWSLWKSQLPYTYPYLFRGMAGLSAKLICLFNRIFKV